jgi:uncharacterized protein YndB with AHSA1/START domain
MIRRAKELIVTIVIKTSQILVHAPLQATFAYVSDLSLHPQWNGGLKIEAVTPGPIAVGKEYISHGEVAVQKDRPNAVRISQYEPPHKFGFIANDPDFGKVSHEFTLSIQNGDVLIVRAMTVALHPIMAFLFRVFIYPLIGRPSMNESMAALKRKLEENNMGSSS